MFHFYLSSEMNSTGISNINPMKKKLLYLFLVYSLGLGCRKKDQASKPELPPIPKEGSIHLLGSSMIANG